MDDCIYIYREFEELQIPGKDDWLLERYGEVRKMIKVQLKEIEQKEQQDWSDWLLTIDQHTRNFNNAIKEIKGIKLDNSFIDLGYDEDEWLDLCVSDLL